MPPTISISEPNLLIKTQIKVEIQQRSDENRHTISRQHNNNDAINNINKINLT